MRLRARSALGAAGVWLCVAAGAPALAEPTGTPAADAVLKVLELDRATIGDVRHDGDRIVLDDLVLPRREGGPAEPNRIGRLEMLRPRMTGEEVVADELLFSGVELPDADTGTGLTMTRVVVREFGLPVEGAADLGGARIFLHTAREVAAEEITVRNAHLGGAVRIAGVRYRVSPSPQRTDITMAVENARMDASDVPMVGATLSTLGLPVLRGSLTLDMTWSPPQETATLREFELNADGLGTATVRARYGGLTESVRSQFSRMGSDGDAFYDGYGALQLEEMIATLTDDGLVELLLTVVALQQGSTAEAVRTQFLDAPLLPPTNDPNEALVLPVVAALREFLRDPQRITMRIAPQTAMSPRDLRRLPDETPRAMFMRIRPTITAGPREPAPQLSATP